MVLDWSSHIDSRPMALPQNASFWKETYVRSHALISEDGVIVFITKFMMMMPNIKYADSSPIYLHMSNNHMWLTWLFQCVHLHFIFSTWKEWKIV